MYITYNPLFKLSDVATKNKDISFRGEPWITKTSHRILMFSKGQWALQSITASEMRKRNKRKGKIFVPEYFCEISLAPLRMARYDLFFYRIMSNYEPDIDHLNRLCGQHGSPEVLIFVHYFGVPHNISDTQSWCRKNNVVLIEDAAHSLIPVTGIGDNGNPIFYTPWKFLNTPDGALLILPEHFEYNAPMYDSKNDGSSSILKWLIKQVILSMSNRMKVPLHRFRGVSVKGHDVSEPIVAPGSPLCSTFSINLLSKYEKTLKEISLKRKANYQLIDEVFLNPEFKRYRMFENVPASFAPYVYPFRISAIYSFDLMIKLNKKGIPALPWSDLSPEVKGSEEYPLANALRREVITLPVHQDLSLNQLNWIKKQVQQLLGKL